MMGSTSSCKPNPIRRTRDRMTPSNNSAPRGPSGVGETSDKELDQGLERAEAG